MGVPTSNGRKGGGLLIRGARDGEELRGLLITNGEGREPTSKGDGREERGDGKAGGENSPHKVKVSTINTGNSSNTQMDGHDRFQYLAR